MFHPPDTGGFFLFFFCAEVVQGLLDRSFPWYFPCLWYQKHKSWTPWPPTFGASQWSEYT